MEMNKLAIIAFNYSYSTLNLGSSILDIKGGRGGSLVDLSHEKLLVLGKLKYTTLKLAS